MKSGCFGSVISYDASDSFCQECLHFSECRESVGDRLIELRATLDVSSYIRDYNMGQVKAGEAEIEQEVVSESVMPQKVVRKRPARRELTEAQQAIVDDETKPKKSRDLVRTLFRKGVCGEWIKARIKAGSNPFNNEKPETMRIVCQLLMNGGFTRRELKEALMMNSQMGDSTASAQVSLLCGALPMLRVAYEENGRFVMGDEE